MNDIDSRFFRAIAVGAIWGAVVLWALLTAIFSVLTDQTLATTAGFSLLPGIFCGPFLGGLFTTSQVKTEEPLDGHVEALADTVRSKAA